MDREAIPYVVVGAAAASRRRSREVASAGMRVAGVAAWPAAVVWRSPLARPVRTRVDGFSLSLEREGRELIGRANGELSLIADEVIDRLLSSGAFDRIVTVVINHPATEALVVTVVDEPALERLVSRVMESRLVDGITAQLLASDELQSVLDYITRSPELRAALAHQTAGMVEDVAVGVRTRTFNADAATERFAGRLLKRRRKPEPQQ